MKLFQIEEPDGRPSDPDMPGAAVGIDVAGPLAEVAAAVGGNAALLDDRQGFELILAVPATTAAVEAWRTLFEGVRLRAERALARPVTHIVIAGVIDGGVLARLAEAAAAAGLAVLRITTPGELPPAERPALAAAILAEELAPRPPADFA